MRLATPVRLPLALDRVRFAGEEVAVVIAETAAQARDAADLIEVEYEELEVLIGPARAMASSVNLHDNIPGNVCFDYEYGDEKATADCFARAAGVVTLDADSPRVAPTPMEIRGALVSWDEASDVYEFVSPNQGNGSFGHELSLMTGIPHEKIRVPMLDVGGAFGARTAPFPEYPVLMWLAKRLKRPIKWLSTRSEDFLTDNHGRAISLRGELAYDANGKFLAIRTEWLCDSGAYLAHAGAFTNSNNGRVIAAGAYQVEAFYGRHRQVMTNTAPTNAYRGAGRPEANYIIERLVDEAAAKLDMDPFELRRRNMLKKSQFPYRTLTGAMFDSADFHALAAKVKIEADWKGFPARRRQSRKDGKLRGIGSAVFIEPSGGGGMKKDEVAVVFEKDGSVTLHSVAGPSGQGHETVFPQLLAGWLGIDAEKVTLRAGDPDGPHLVGHSAIGSRSAFSQGSSYKIASDMIIDKARKIAADELEASASDIEFRNGVFTIAGTDRAMTMTKVIEKACTMVPSPLDTIAEYGVSLAFPSGAHVVEVEIDPDTGKVDVVRYTATDDIGNVLNPVLANGQISGGIVQGAGQVFGEICQYDETDGQLITGSFMDYFMPRAHLIPEVHLTNVVSPSPNNPLGVKGVGEAGTTGSMPACMNAVLNALRTVGVKHFDMPATPSRIWSAIAAAKNSAA
jgi:carbon-monoxide dehydrogenase large subunit